MFNFGPISHPSFKFEQKNFNIYLSFELPQQLSSSLCSKPTVWCMVVVALCMFPVKLHCKKNYKISKYRCCTVCPAKSQLIQRHRNWRKILFIANWLSSYVIGEYLKVFQLQLLPEVYILENTLPPRGRNISRCHLEKKYEKGKETKGENMKENARKGKEKEEMGVKRENGK
jgi:hypothetical protein